MNKQFLITLKQAEVWDLSRLQEKLQKYDARRPEYTSFQKRVVNLTKTVTEINDMIIQRRAVVMSFRNNNEWFVYKQFLSYADYSNEVAVLTLFNEDPVLHKYIVPFDPITLQRHFAIIYKRLTPLYDIITQFSPQQIDRLIDWNIQLLNDMRSRNKRLCDHKLDNILYDLDQKTFYITDLEAVVPLNSSCRVWTFLDLDIDLAPILFDHLHFLASLTHVGGISREIDQYILSIASRYQQKINTYYQQNHKPGDKPITYISNDFIIVTIICLSMMRFKINQRYIEKITQQMTIESRRPPAVPREQIGNINNIRPKSAAPTFNQAQTVRRINQVQAPAQQRQYNPQAKGPINQYLHSIARHVISEHIATYPNSTAVNDILYILQEHQQSIESDIKYERFFNTCDLNLTKECRKLSVLLLGAYLRCILNKRFQKPIQFETIIITMHDLYLKVDADLLTLPSGKGISGLGKSFALQDEPRDIKTLQQRCDRFACLIAVAALMSLLIVVAFDQYFIGKPCHNDTQTSVKGIHLNERIISPVV